MCNVKVAHSDKPTGNYHPALHFLLAFKPLLALCIWSLTLHSAVFSEKALINPLYATCPAPNSRKVSDKLVNIVEHLAAK